MWILPWEGLDTHSTTLRLKVEGLGGRGLRKYSLSIRLQTCNFPILNLVSSHHPPHPLTPSPSEDDAEDVMMLTKLRWLELEVANGGQVWQFDVFDFLWNVHLFHR